jgi:hypothetical protein
LKPSVVNTLLEIAGFLLIVVFAYVVWAPAALLVAGLGLVAAALAGERAEAKRGQL